MKAEILEALKSLRVSITLSANSDQCDYSPNQVHAIVSLFYVNSDGKFEEISESKTYLDIDTGILPQDTVIVPNTPKDSVSLTEEQKQEINEYLREHSIVREK